MPFSRTYPLLLAALLLGLAGVQPTAAQAPTEPIYTHPTQMPRLPALGPVHLKYDLEQRMVLPPGYPEDLEHSVAVYLEISKTGRVENARVLPADAGVSAVIAAAILTAVRQLPIFEPGRQAGQPVRVALTLPIRPGIAAAIANKAVEARAAAKADSTEARTLRAGTIRPQSGETLGQLLHRTLPASCPDTATRLVRYAWFANAAGPQRFFDTRGHGEQGQYGAVLIVLNPLATGTYDVQAFDLDSMGDMTDVISVFFTDSNHDGQKELLAITQCDLREGPTKEYPLGWREAHYQTHVLHYQGQDAAGRPRYEAQYRADLDELATAAAVRQALAAPPRQPTPKPAAKRNPAAKTAK